MDTHAFDSDPSDLLDELRWLQTLARALVRDPQTADDLAQETLLVAWNRRGRPTRAWLARVMRNFARMRERGEERRKHHESSSHPLADCPTPEELAGIVEQQTRLAEIVTRLAEPYRSTVISRYWEGLSTKEIAEREGVAAVTVRSRLGRALAKLRQEMDNETEGGRLSWTSALAPLLGPEPSVKPAALAAITGGGMLMGKWTWLVVASVVLSLIGVWSVLPDTSDPPVVAPVAAKDKLATLSIDESESVAGKRIPAIAVNQDEALEARPTRSTELAAGWWLTGSIRHADETTAVTVVGESFGVEEELTASTRDDGSVSAELAQLFELEGVLLQRLRVRIDHPDFMPTEQVFELTREDRQAGFLEGERATFPLDVTLEPITSRVNGRVIVPAGMADIPITVALHRIDGSGDLSRDAIESVACGANGEYSLRARERGQHWVIAWFDGPRHSWLSEVPRPGRCSVDIEGEQTSVPDLVLDAGAEVSGRVVMAHGESAAGVCLWLTQRIDGQRIGSLVLIGDELSYRERGARCDAEGRFRFSGLSPLDWEILWSAGTVLAPAQLEGRSGRISLQVPCTTLLLSSESVLINLKALSAGVALASSKVAVRTSRHGGHSVHDTNDEGELELELRKDEVLNLTLSKPGFVSAKLRIANADLRHGQVIRCELEAGEPRASMRILLSGDAQRKFERGRATFRSLEEEPEPGTVPNPITAARLGDALVFADLPAGRYEVDLEPFGVTSESGHGTCFITETFDVELFPGEEFVMNLALREGARLFVPSHSLPGDELWSFTLLDANGERVDTVIRSIWNRDGTKYVGWGHEIHPHAECELKEVLAPGHYTLELAQEGEPQRVIPLALAAGQRIDLKDLLDG